MGSHLLYPPSSINWHWLELVTIVAVSTRSLWKAVVAHVDLWSRKFCTNFAFWAYPPCAEFLTFWQAAWSAKLLRTRKWHLKDPIIIGRINNKPCTSTGTLFHSPEPSCDLDVSVRIVCTAMTIILQPPFTKRCYKSGQPISCVTKATFSVQIGHDYYRKSLYRN